MIVTKQVLNIDHIPAILWGDASDRLILAVHGNMSHKADDVIVIVAEEATRSGYQVLSFDLPEHGDRKEEGIACSVQNAVRELNAVMRYAQSLSPSIRLFACSLGAYFSLVSYGRDPIEQCFFLSPVVDMERILTNMMAGLQISEDRLQAEKIIPTPYGPPLDWDYYCYVKEHPIASWSSPTSILYGAADQICELEVIRDFVGRFDCSLTLLEAGEHFFHTEEQLQYFRQWLNRQWSLGGTDS